MNTLKFPSEGTVVILDDDPDSENYTLKDMEGNLLAVGTSRRVLSDWALNRGVKEVKWLCKEK